MSLPQDGTIRGLTRQDVDRITKKLHEERLIHSCMTCANFEEESELCKLYKERPPARVIAYGCPSWDDELPF